MKTLETTYRVRGETVTVVTEPLRTRKATHTEHMKRRKLAVQVLYSNVAPAWLAELEAWERTGWRATGSPLLPDAFGNKQITASVRRKQVERTAAGLGMGTIRLPFPLRWLA